MTTTFAKQISKEEINDLPTFEHPGKIILIETAPGAIRAINEIKGSKVLGFDTETRPSFSKGESYPVCMLQLATHECAYLFRLNKIPFTQELADILSDPTIVKAGVAIHDDLKGLQKLFPFTPGGFVDVAKAAEKNGITTFGLRALTAIFLGARLSKAAKVTNWERSPLTDAQLLYAANDAFAGLMIYEKMPK